MTRSMSFGFIPTVLPYVTFLFVGYYVGKLYGSATEKGEDKAPDAKLRITVEDEPQEDEDEDEGDIADGELSVVQPGFMEPCKMVKQ